MKVTSFEQNKAVRLINTQGAKFTFFRSTIDEFKEPTEEEKVAEIKGVFHRLSSHISVIGMNASTVQSKRTPYILALYPEAKELQQGDIVYINGRKHKVTGATNIGEMNTILDISLEEVL